MGHPLGVPTSLDETERELLELFLVDRGQRAGLSWARQAKLLGYPDGKTLKNHVKKVARQRERELRKGPRGVEA